MKYPFYIRPKLGGIPCSIENGIPVFNNGSVYPSSVAYGILHGLPPMVGTIICGLVTQHDENLGKELLGKGAPEFTFWVWDVRTRGALSFKERLELLKSYTEASGACVVSAMWRFIEDEEQLRAYEVANSSFLEFVIQDPDQC